MFNNATPLRSAVGMASAYGWEHLPSARSSQRFAAASTNDRFGEMVPLV
jgi:hypothetical protein